MILLLDELGDLLVVVNEVSLDLSEEDELSVNEVLGVGVVVLLNSAVVLVGNDQLGVLLGELGDELDGFLGGAEVSAESGDGVLGVGGVEGVLGEESLDSLDLSAEDFASGSGFLLVVVGDFDEGDSELSEPLEESSSDLVVVSGELDEALGDDEFETLQLEECGGDFFEVFLDERLVGFLAFFTSGFSSGGGGFASDSPVGDGLDGLLGGGDGVLGGSVSLVEGGGALGFSEDVSSVETFEPGVVDLHAGGAAGGVVLLLVHFADELAEGAFLGLVVVLSLGEFHGGDVASGFGLSPDFVGDVELLSAVVDELVQKGEDSVEASFLLELDVHGGEHGFTSGVGGHF